MLNNPLRSIDPNGLILCDYGPSDNGGDDFEDADTADECTNNGGTLPSDQVTVNVNSSATDVPTFENGVQIFPLVCPSGTAAQALSTFNNTVSRVIAGVTAPANFAVGATKVLGGLVGAVAAPSTGPVAAVAELGSDWVAWNGFGQVLSAGASAYYAVSGSESAEQFSNEAISLTTVSGLVVFGLGGSPKVRATLGSIENGVPTETSTMAAADAIIGLTELGGKLLQVGSPCP